jgi:hypothetical protein
MSLGFMMGKCCSKHGCHKAHSESECSHAKHRECSVWVSEDSDHAHGDEMIIVKALMEDGFEGDTTLTIPGGEIVISINDGEVNVDVEIEEYTEYESHEGHDHE